MMSYKAIGNAVFVGCMFLGLGASFLFNIMPAGLFIGLGTGFGLRALIHFIARERAMEQGLPIEEEEEKD